MPKATEITPNLSLLSEALYESEFISQIWMLYNSHKQFVSCGDAYAQKWSVKVRIEEFCRGHNVSERFNFGEDYTLNHISIYPI